MILLLVMERGFTTVYLIRSQKIQRQFSGQR